MKFLFVFTFLQFLITQRRANLLPPYPLIYHNPRMATEDWDGKSEQMGIRPPRPHAPLPPTGGGGGADWLRDPGFGAGKLPGICGSDALMWVLLFSIMTQHLVALLCLNYGWIGAALENGRRHQDCMTFLPPRHYNLSSAAITPPGRHADGVQDCRENSL